MVRCRTRLDQARGFVPFWINSCAPTTVGVLVMLLLYHGNQSSKLRPARLSAPANIRVYPTRSGVDISSPCTTVCTPPSISVRNHVSTSNRIMFSFTWKADSKRIPQGQMLRSSPADRFW